MKGGCCQNHKVRWKVRLTDIWAHENKRSGGETPSRGETRMWSYWHLLGVALEETGKVFERTG